MFTREMKKTLLATITLTFLLVLMLTGFHSVKVTNAQFPSPPASPIFITSPSNATSYSINLLNLNASIEGMIASNENISMAYSLDAGDNISLPISYQDNGVPFTAIIIGATILPPLLNGNHSITVYVEFDEYNVGVGGTFYPKYVASESSLVNFTIDAIPQPTTTPSPSPSPSLSPTPKHQTGFFGTNLPVEYGYAIVAVLVIIAVAGLSLVYLKKRRK